MPKLQIFPSLVQGRVNISHGATQKEIPAPTKSSKRTQGGVLASCSQGLSQALKVVLFFRNSKGLAILFRVQ